MPRPKRETSSASASVAAALKEAARSGDPRETAGALLRWLDRVDGADGPATLQQLARGSGDPELATELRALEAAVYGRGAAEVAKGWTGTVLLEQSRRERPGTASAIEPYRHHSSVTTNRKPSVRNRETEPQPSQRNLCCQSSKRRAEKTVPATHTP